MHKPRRIAFRQKQKKATVKSSQTSNVNFIAMHAVNSVNHWHVCMEEIRVKIYNLVEIKILFNCAIYCVDVNLYICFIDLKVYSGNLKLYSEF